MNNLLQQAVEQKLMAPALEATLDNLGLEEFQTRLLRQAMARPVGAIIVAGTCGSGVTTTLRTLLVEQLNVLYRNNKCVRIVEQDEFDIESSTTIVVPSDDSGSPFEQAMRLAMRLDPDVVHLGEVRDEESVKAMMSMSLSGHQVLTEVHASSALHIPLRLKCMGASPENLADHHGLSALVYQTLLGVVCPHCALDLEGAKQAATADHEREQMTRIEQVIDPALYAGLRFRNENGCECCRNGVIGRTWVGEVIIPDDTLRECFRQGMEVETFVHHRKQGGVIALEHGISKALRGIVDLRDVEYRLDLLIRMDEVDQLMGVDRGNEPFVIKADPLARHIAQASE
jgi:type II secretory ATPase GspE/PulE/Tfp pilus assembly ATPase PilB-like protein